MTALIILKEEMQDIIKIGKSLGESGLLIKGYRETIKNESRQQKGTFLEMFIGYISLKYIWEFVSRKT